VVLVYLALLFLATSLIVPTPGSASAPAPGSSAWNGQMLVDEAVKLGVAGMMAMLLAQARQGQRQPPRGRHTARFAMAVVGLLMLLPLTLLQDEAGQVVWHWLYPEAPAPLHVVLQALFQNAWGVWGTVHLVVGAVLVAPLVEELFFRGVLLQALCLQFKLGWVAVAVSAVAFGGVHAQPQDVLPLVTMGVVLGYLRLRTGALWPCMLVHALFNARTMLFVILEPDVMNEL